jgi:hypothetical protein
MTAGRPSRSLVLETPPRFATTRHHEAFIIDASGECTVELEGHRSACNLDALDPGGQPGAVA